MGQDRLADGTSYTNAANMRQASVTEEQGAGNRSKSMITSSAACAVLSSGFARGPDLDQGRRGSTWKSSLPDLGVM